MKVHPAAKAIPAMLLDEYEALKANIELRGLLVPVETLGGKILDGRHRVKACKELGIEPDIVEVDLDGMSPAEYVWSVNGVRRHLTPSQRAAVAVELMPELRVEAKQRQRERKGKQPGASRAKMPDLGRARDHAAAIVGVSPRYVSYAEKLRDESPKAYQAMKAGSLTLQQAKKIVRQERQSKIEEKAALCISITSLTPPASRMDSLSSSKMTKLPGAKCCHLRYTVVIFTRLGGRYGLGPQTCKDDTFPEDDM